MRANDDGHAAAQTLQRPDDLPLAALVHGRCRLVEEQQTRSPQQSSCDENAGSLSSRKELTTLSNFSIETVWKRLNEGERSGLLTNTTELVIAHISAILDTMSQLYQ